MSDNTEILIVKKNGKWNVYHHSVGCDYKKKIGGSFKSLEDAVEFSNKWEKDFYGDFGEGAEYGLRIINKDKKGVGNLKN